MYRVYCTRHRHWASPPSDEPTIAEPRDRRLETPSKVVRDLAQAAREYVSKAVGALLGGVEQVGTLTYGAGKCARGRTCARSKLMFVLAQVPRMPLLMKLDCGVLLSTFALCAGFGVLTPGSARALATLVPSVDSPRKTRRRNPTRSNICERVHLHRHQHARHLRHVD